MEAKCVIAFSIDESLTRTRDQFLRATNQLLNVAYKTTISAIYVRRPDACPLCIPYKYMSKDYQTLLDHMRRYLDDDIYNDATKNESIEAIKWETAGCLINTHFVSYMKNILEKLKSIHIKLHHCQLLRQASSELCPPGLLDRQDGTQCCFYLS